jgi:hypothetical protein
MSKNLRESLGGETSLLGNFVPDHKAGDSVSNQSSATSEVGVITRLPGADKAIPLHGSK